MLSSPTEADRELQVLSDAGKIRLFSFGGSQPEQVIMFARDYQIMLRQAAARFADGGKWLLSAVIRRFAEAVVPGLCVDRLDAATVHDLMFGGGGGGGGEDGGAAPPRGDEYATVWDDGKGVTAEDLKDLMDAEAVPAVPDKVAGLCVQAGVLVAMGLDSYAAAIPSGGIFMRALVKGRKAVIRALKRTKLKELRESDLVRFPSLALVGVSILLCSCFYVGVSCAHSPAVSSWRKSR